MKQQHDDPKDKVEPTPTTDDVGTADAPADESADGGAAEDTDTADTNDGTGEQAAKEDAGDAADAGTDDADDDDDEGGGNAEAAKETPAEGDEQGG